MNNPIDNNLNVLEGHTNNSHKHIIKGKLYKIIEPLYSYRLNSTHFSLASNNLIFIIDLAYINYFDTVKNCNITKHNLTYLFESQLLFTGFMDINSLNDYAIRNMKQIS